MNKARIATHVEDLVSSGVPKELAEKLATGWEMALADAIFDAEVEHERVQVLAVTLAKMVESFAPTLEAIHITEILNENARSILDCARAILGKPSNLTLPPESVVPEQGGVRVTGRHWGMQCFALSFGESLRRPDGTFWNNMQAEFNHPEAGEIVATLQRKDGKKLADQLSEAKVKAEARREALEKVKELLLKIETRHENGDCCGVYLSSGVCSCSAEEQEAIFEQVGAVIAEALKP